MNRKITKPTDAAALLSPRPDLGVERVDDDLLILDRTSKKIHQLNRTASLVWLGLEDGLEPQDIVREITESFDVSPEHAFADVDRIINEFRTLRLLRNAVAEQQQTATTRSVHRDHET